MTTDDLEQRFRLGEDSENEFKGVARSDFKIHTDEIVRAIVAFANSGGGRLFIGVEDDGTLTGLGTVKQADLVMRQVSQACQDAINPPLVVNQTKVELRDQVILVVEVPGFQPDRPFRTTKTYWLRDANRVREASRDELARLFHSASPRFDEEPVHGVSADELDPDLSWRFVHAAFPAARREDVRNYLRAVKATIKGAPTVSGILLFSREPERWLPSAHVSGVRFAGVQPGLEFEEKSEITGSLIDQLEASVAFLKRHIGNPAHVEGLLRREEGVPHEVFREVILNALTHRDYRVNSQTKVFVYADRFEIINPGSLLNQLTRENILLGGIAQERNPILASVLSRYGGRESLGVGLPEVVRLLADRGLPPPEIQLDGGHFRIVIQTRRSSA